MDRDKLAYLYAIIASVLWGSTPAVGKLLLKELNNLQIYFYISLIATITLFFIVLFKRKLILVKNLRKKDYLIFAMMGFLGIFLYNILFYGALMLSAAQEAFIINYTWPIWIVIFSIFILKEEFRLKKIIAILLSFVGIYLVITKGDFGSLFVFNIQGIILALAGAICYGLFSVLGKKYNYDRFVSMMFYYAFGFMFALLTTILFSRIPLVSFIQLMGLIWLGVFPAGIAFICWFLALKYGDTSKMSNVIFLTPFISLVYIYLLTGEKILISSIIGLCFIVLGIIIQSKRKNS